MIQKQKQNKTSASLEFELLAKGYTRVIGIDEAGRGCWAGPVAIGAYEFDLNTIVNPLVTDSKLISENKRLEIIKQFDAKRFFVAMATSQEIDIHGISRIIEIKIKEIIARYNDPHTYFLIDGQFSEKFVENSSKIIKGDLKHYSIAAASIAAKVTRDLLMQKYDLEFPNYGFAMHKGYGTQLHHEKLLQLGVTSIHRRSYAPIKKLLAKHGN